MTQELWERPFVGSGVFALREPTTIIDARRFLGRTPSKSKDVSSLLQNAANAAAAESAEKEIGALIQLPPWTMEIGAEVLFDNRVGFIGHGNASQIRQGNGSNLNALLKSKRYNEGGTTGGTERNYFYNFDMDGNRAGQSGGECICLLIDGVRPIVDLLFIKNGKLNLKTIMSQTSKASERLEDGQYTRLGLLAPLEWNFLCEGPHDSTMWGILAQSNSELQPNIETKTAALIIPNFCHAYGNAVCAWRVGSGHLYNCTGEGGRIAQVQLLGDGHCLIGGRYFNGGGADGKIGIKFGNAEKTAFTTQIQGVKIEKCTNGSFDFSNATGSNSVIQALVSQESGEMCVGGAPANSINWNGTILTGGATWGNKSGLTEIASAAEIALSPLWRGVHVSYKVSGVVEITKCKEVPPANTVVTFYFASTAKLVKGNNFQIASNFEGAANRTITMMSDGTNLIELGRSVN